jgi:dihydropteroate synthase
MFPPRHSYAVPLAHHGVLRLGERALVMGILNLTPDSFAESRPLDKMSAVDAALRMEAEGADVLDIGGESTRPGAAPVSASDEIARVVPVIQALAGRLRIPISIDTYKGAVARAGLSEGAALVNDVTGLRLDESLAGVVADCGAALVLMHSRGRSGDMYAQARYEDVVNEVTTELHESIHRAIAAGISRDRLILDPGIGFAKRAAHSYGVLARLPEIAARVDRPLLVGPSRKSFMSEALGQRPATERDWGTAAAVTAAVLAGAHIVRVHAVGEMVQVVRVAEQIRKGAETLSTNGLDH